MLWGDLSRRKTTRRRWRRWHLTRTGASWLLSSGPSMSWMGSCQNSQSSSCRREGLQGEHCLPILVGEKRTLATHTHTHNTHTHNTHTHTHTQHTHAVSITRVLTPSSQLDFNLCSCSFHVARTTCRRAERSLVALRAREAVQANALHFLNRLSDFFFACARFSAYWVHEPEVTFKAAEYVLTLP